MSRRHQLTATRAVRATPPPDPRLLYATADARTGAAESDCGPPKAVFARSARLPEEIFCMVPEVGLTLGGVEPFFSIVGVGEAFRSELMPLLPQPCIED